MLTPNDVDTTATPPPQGTAFSGEVILNRCDPWWLRCVGDGARHHLYPVRVSGCLLSTPSLSAALYLQVSRFVAGQYEQVGIPPPPPPKSVEEHIGVYRPTLEGLSTRYPATFLRFFFVRFLGFELFSSGFVVSPD